MGSFSERLKFYRAQKCLSQQDLANLSGLHQVSIANFETGKSVPSAASIRKLASALDVPLSSLTSDEQPPALSVPDQHVQPDEQRLLDLYRACDMETRRMLLATAEAYVLRSLKINIGESK